MLTALVLICSVTATTDLRDCTREERPHGGARGPRSSQCRRSASCTRRPMSPKRRSVRSAANEGVKIVWRAVQEGRRPRYPLTPVASAAAHRDRSARPIVRIRGDQREPPLPGRSRKPRARACGAASSNVSNATTLRQTRRATSPAHCFAAARGNDRRPPRRHPRQRERTSRRR